MHPAFRRALLVSTFRIWKVCVHCYDSAIHSAEQIRTVADRKAKCLFGSQIHSGIGLTGLYRHRLIYVSVFFLLFEIWSCNCPDLYSLVTVFVFLIVPISQAAYRFQSLVNSALKGLQSSNRALCKQGLCLIVVSCLSVNFYQLRKRQANCTMSWYNWQCAVMQWEWESFETLFKRDHLQPSDRVSWVELSKSGLSEESACNRNSMAFQYGITSDITGTRRCTSALYALTSRLWTYRLWMGNEQCEHVNDGVQNVSALKKYQREADYERISWNLLIWHKYWFPQSIRNEVVQFLCVLSFRSFLSKKYVHYFLGSLAPDSVVLWID